MPEWAFIYSTYYNSPSGAFIFLYVNKHPNKITFYILILYSFLLIAVAFVAARLAAVDT